MNRDKIIACILISIILIMSITSTHGTTVDELPYNADAYTTVLYLSGNIRYMEYYLYDAYWSNSFQEMEDALYAATNDCEYLYRVAEDLADKVR